VSEGKEGEASTEALEKEVAALREQAKRSREQLGEQEKK
jgi:hypothetical protein